MKPLLSLLILLLTCLHAASAAEHSRDARIRIVNADLSALWSDPEGRIWIAGGMDGSLLRSEDAGSHWQQVKVAERFHAYRIKADRQGRTLLALAEDRLLRSEDVGASWQTVTHPQNLILTSVMALQDGKTWLGTDQNGKLLRSTDAARSWQYIPLPARTPPLMAINQSESGKLYAAGAQGALLYSADGRHWKSVHTGVESHISQIQVLPGKSGVLALWASGAVTGLSETGASWRGNSIGPETPTSSTWDPVGEQVLVGNNQGQVWRSRDKGKTWKVSTVQDRIHIAGIIPDPQDGSLNLAGGRGTLARSNDGGATWKLLYGNQWTSRFNALTGNASGQLLLAAGTGGLIWRSTNRGQSWSPIQSDLKRYIREIVPGAARDEVIAAGADGLLIQSLDAGNTWSALTTGLPNDVSILSLIRKDNTLLATGPMGSFLQSTDGGETWQSQQPIPNAGDGYLSQIQADPDSDTLLATSADRLMRSTDGGQNWAALTQGPESRIEQLAALGQGLFVGLSQDGQLLRSTDRGLHWQSIEGGSKGLLHPDAQGLWLLGSGRLLRSQDKGLSWQQIQIPAVSLTSMLRTNNQTLLGFGSKGAILRSTDGGVSWRAVASGTTSSLRQALQNPRNGEIFVAGRDGHILRSRDDGQSWDKLPTHTLGHLNRLWLSANGRVLLASGERLVRIEFAE